MRARIAAALCHSRQVAPHKTFEFDNCRLAYRIEGAGPPLVMLQGVGAEGTAPNPLLDILKKHYSCLTFDNRGTGSSLPLGTQLTVDQMAADALALMEHAGWTSAHIVGHSLGGLVALQAALEAKPRVRSLALLCTFARGADATRMTPKLLWITLRLRFGTRSIRRRAFMELVLPPGRKEPAADKVAALLSTVFGHDIADLPPITDRQIAAMRGHDVTSRLHELSGITTLVVTGEKDTIAPPSSGRVIAAGIPGARYIEIPGASHAFPILEPERCGALILQNIAVAERTAPRSASDGTTPASC